MSARGSYAVFMNIISLGVNIVLFYSILENTSRELVLRKFSLNKQQTKYEPNFLQRDTVSEANIIWCNIFNSLLAELYLHCD